MNGGLQFATHIGVAENHQFTLKPKKSPGHSWIHSAAQTKSGSSIWTALLINGPRQTTRTNPITTRGCAEIQDFFKFTGCDSVSKKAPRTLLDPFGRPNEERVIH